jgi:hypothetical protein
LAGDGPLEKTDQSFPKRDALAKARPSGRRLVYSRLGCLGRLPSRGARVCAFWFSRGMNRPSNRERGDRENYQNRN